MDIDFENSPFSNFDGFTNKELEDIWKYLFIEKSKLPDKLTIQNQMKTDNGILVFASKDKDIKQIEFSFTGVDIFKDNLFLTKIYCKNQLETIIKILQNSDKYILKFHSDKSSIEINTKIDLEEKNFKDYITRERMFNFDEEIKEDKVQEIEKLRLSPYFDNII